MESAPADELKKRWFVEGLRTSLRKKMKIVPPTSYNNAYNRAMDLESECKTSKKTRSSSDDDSETKSSEDRSSKKVLALQRDLERMMRELKAAKGSTSKTEEDTVWCTDCKEPGHTKGSCPKKAFCDICQNCWTFHQRVSLQFEGQKSTSISYTGATLDIRKRPTK